MRASEACEACEANVRGMNKTCEASEACEADVRGMNKTSALEKPIWSRKFTTSFHLHYCKIKKLVVATLPLILLK